MDEALLPPASVHRPLPFLAKLERSLSLLARVFPLLPVRDSHAPRVAHASLHLPRVILRCCTQLFTLFILPMIIPFELDDSKYLLHFHLQLGVVRGRLVRHKAHRSSSSR